jgi:hypothetical protein
MGRQPWSDRLTVEECISLSVREFLQFDRRSYLSRISTSLSWAEGDGQAGIECMLSWDQGQLVLHLSNPLTGSGALIREQVIRTTSTPCRFGGKRLWFECPGLHGVPCGRRCTTLYLPPGVGVFACRQCNRLTYESVQTHDARVDRLVRNPNLLSSALRSPKLRTSLLGVSAYKKLVRCLLSKRRRRELDELLRDPSLVNLISLP